MATLTSRLIVALTDRVSGPARGIGASIDRLNRRATRMNGALLGGGTGMVGGSVRNLLAVGAGYVGVTRGIGGTVGAAIKFEEAFADVRKVVDGTPAQLAMIRAEILGMSKVLPVTAEGMAAIYAAAGQSNIPIAELGKFSEMVAKVSVAWETTESETSEALAKIKNQLNMSVSEIGLYADAINELGNRTAAAAPDLVTFSKMVAANGEMFGFSATQTLAFGGAMVATGARTEVAATSFRNMGRALTIGTRATKMQSTAFSRLGLDSVKTAKKMQKNALDTTLDVLDRIQKLPEWERISIASALFGDEARGLMPVIADTRELRRQIALVANETEYAGSAFQEYLVRAETTGNALTIIGNKFRAVGIGIGDSWLPTIKELGAGIGDVLDTLEKRVGVLDQVKFAFQGFMGGVGYGGTGGARDLMNDLGDLLFGEAFGGSLKDADDRMVGLARLSNRFRGIGQDLKSFADNVSGGNIGAAIGDIGDAISNMSGGMTVAGALAIAFTGRALLGLASGAAALAFSKTGQIFLMAMAVSTLINAVKDASSLGEFVDNLAGLSALEWAAIGAGLLLVAGRAARVVGWFRQLGKLAPAAAAAGGAVATAQVATKGGGASIAAAGTKQGAGWLSRLMSGGDRAKDIVASGRASTERTALEKIGQATGRLGAATGMVGRAAGRLLGLPAIAGEIATRALLATPPTDPRLADPAFAPLAYRRAEDRNAGRRQEPQQVQAPAPSAPQPFSFGQMFKDLFAPIGGSAGAAKQKVDELNAVLTSATAEWPAAAQTGIQSYIDAIAAGGGQAGAEADRIGAGIKEALTVTGQPSVDTSQLQRALDVARQLGNAVRNLGAASVGAPTRAVDGQRARGGSVRKGGAYLVGEEGPEIVEFGRAGYVHDAMRSAKAMRDMMRRGALASALSVIPAAAAAPADVAPTASALRQPAAPVRHSTEINLGGVSFTIHAAPGQSPEQIAEAVERKLSAKLNALSRGAYTD